VIANEGDASHEELLAEIAQLRAALVTRDTIGQAKGIIIASTGCTPDEAFQLLVEQSQTENRKLRDVAADLVNSQVRPRPDATRAGSCRHEH
jgi:AmiR/NasT family two-component response regulator